jgi:hypothetical protein
MANNIRPVTLDDLPDLSRFLTVGFHAPPQADFIAPEVLRWKYLEPLDLISAASAGAGGGDQHDSAFEPESGINAHAPRSYIARDEAGRIIGHLGLCRTAFEGQAITSDGGRVATIHIIDWLGSPEHRSVGMSLMRLAHQGVATQFGLGVSQSALAVGERAGYELRSLVPVYNRVLRAGYWRRTGGSGLVKRSLRLARDAMSQVTHIPSVPRVSISLQRVSAFGPEIMPIVAKTKVHTILTHRDPARLNAFLRFPRQQMSGWHLIDDSGRLRGLAVLNLVPQDQGRTHTGKVVDCVVDEIEVALWHAVIMVLTRELARQGADLAQVYASTPWTAEALRRSGYTSRFAVKFHLRDRLGLIPHDARFHLTPLEGDYAYT